MVSFSLLGLQHPEPNDSRRATPTSTFQHRAGHSPNDRRIPLTGVYEVIGVDALSDGQLDFWLNDWKIRLTILARADFTGDGLEDLLLLSSGGTIMGRGAWAHLFLLTREASNTVFHVPNLERHVHWRCGCEEVLDDTEIIRDSDPGSAD
jgi:hypothetical protein